MDTAKTRQTTQTAHRQVRSSTTLNRKYVKRPSRVNIEQKSSVTTPASSKGRSIKITHFSSDDFAPSTVAQKTITVTDESEIQPAESHPTQVRAQEKMRARQSVSEKTQAPKLTAKELKEQAIKRALMAAEKQPSMGEQITKSSSGKVKKEKRMKFGLARVALAFSCTVAVIFGIVYFVNLNIPDIQFRAAALQLDATYPNYLPYNYMPSEIAAENGVITIRFKKKNSDEAFTIVEEKSSWDSNALLNNYVKEEYKENYTVLREQGLTIYVSGSNAAWVNGGMVYKLEMKKGSLSKKQISDIAVSF